MDASNGVVEYVATYSDKNTGLKVDCKIKGFQKFNAVEWVLNFTNTGSENTSQITDVKVVDYALLSQKDAAFNVLHALGSNHDRADFKPMMTEVTNAKR